MVLHKKVAPPHLFSFFFLMSSHQHTTTQTYQQTHNSHVHHTNYSILKSMTFWRFETTALSPLSFAYQVISYVFYVILHTSGRKTVGYQVFSGGSLTYRYKQNVPNKMFQRDEQKWFQEKDLKIFFWIPNSIIPHTTKRDFLILKFADNFFRNNSKMFVLILILPAKISRCPHKWSFSKIESLSNQFTLSMWTIWIFYSLINPTPTHNKNAHVVILVFCTGYRAKFFGHWKNLARNLLH